VPGGDRRIVFGDRQALGKITRDGVFLEQLETDPAQYLPDLKGPRTTARSWRST